MVDKVYGIYVDEPFDMDINNKVDIDNNCVGEPGDLLAEQDQQAEDPDGPGGGDSRSRPSTWDYDERET